MVTRAQSDAGVPREAGNPEEECSYRQDLERRAQRRPKPGLTAFSTRMSGRAIQLVLSWGIGTDRITNY